MKTDKFFGEFAKKSLTLRQGGFIDKAANTARAAVPVLHKFMNDTKKAVLLLVPKGLLTVYDTEAMGAFHKDGKWKFVDCEEGEKDFYIWLAADMFTGDIEDFLMEWNGEFMKYKLPDECLAK